MNGTDPIAAALALIEAEAQNQSTKHGAPDQRPDSGGGELIQASIAHLDHTYTTAVLGNAGVELPPTYPFDPAGFRDYGSPVANLTVAAAFLVTEIARRIAAGEATTRTARAT